MLGSASFQVAFHEDSATDECTNFSTRNGHQKLIISLVNQIPIKHRYKKLCHLLKLVKTEDRRSFNKDSTFYRNEGTMES